MDVLSDAVTAMRTGRPHSRRAGRPGPFQAAFPAVGGAGFHIVVRGSCRLTAPGTPPVTLGPGDVAFLPHGTAHTLAGEDTVLLCGAYLLDRSRAHPLLADLPEVVHLPARLDRHRELRAAVDLLGGELEQDRPGHDAMLPALLDVLLLHILRAWFADRPATGWAAALRDPAVAAALRAIHEEPSRPWTVETLGARAGLSRAAFARRFTGLAGRPPLTYLTWWRMTLAARLLTDGRPIAAVAGQVGYTSEFAFAHAFKRERGVAPGSLRARGVTHESL